MVSSISGAGKPGQLPVNEIRAFFRTYLVVQWLRICLPRKGTWIQSLIQKDPTCCGTIKPVL